MLLCLYRLCLSRCACTWVAYVNLNIKRNDDDDDVNVVSKEGDHLLICCTIARISLMVIISLRRRTTDIWPTLFLQSELCHRWLFPSISGVAFPLATRLWKLHIGWTAHLSSATTPVCAQRCSSSGVLASTLRPHQWCPCSPSLAACTTTCRLRSCGHDILL